MIKKDDYTRIIAKCLEKTSADNKMELERAVTEYVYAEQYKYVQDKSGIIKKIMDFATGYGIIQPLMEEEGVTEIMINAGKIFYEKNGLIQEYCVRPDKQDIQQLLTILCRKTDRTVNFSSPILDGSIGSDTRVNIVLNPIADNGDSITIRRFPSKAITSLDMLEGGFMNIEMLEFLAECVRNKSNIFICGGAGCGKTTLLNVLTEYIGKTERVITIEDSIELEINEVPNIVRLSCRNPNSEGVGGIDIAQLIRSSLRMRPDRIIVGEVRGGEVLYMLQAMNTGHIGSISTGHANSCLHAFSRLETMVLTECDMPLSAIRKQIIDAIDIVVCVARVQGVRRIVEIARVNKHSELSLDMLFTYDSVAMAHIRCVKEKHYECS